MCDAGEGSAPRSQRFRDLDSNTRSTCIYPVSHDFEGHLLARREECEGCLVDGLACASAVTLTAAWQQRGSVILALLWISVSMMCWSHQGTNVQAKEVFKAPL